MVKAIRKNKRQTGQQGELIAAAFLRSRGYEIVGTNWHCVYGEIDIIAAKDGVTVFVEVRTRRADTTEPALVSLTGRKRARMVLAAEAYLSNHDLANEWRIDVIAIALWNGRAPVIDHVEDALGW